MDRETLAKGYHPMDDETVRRIVDKHQVWAEKQHDKQIDRARFHLESADRFAAEAVKIVGTVGIAGLVGSSSLLAINPRWIDFDKGAAIQAAGMFGTSLVALIGAVFLAYLMQLAMANAEHSVQFDWSDEPVKQGGWTKLLRAVGWLFWASAMGCGFFSFWRLWDGFHTLTRLF